VIHGELSDDLLSAGEDRFPYFRVVYNDDVSAAGIDSADS